MERGFGLKKTKKKIVDAISVRSGSFFVFTSGAAEPRQSVVDLPSVFLQLSYDNHHSRIHRGLFLPVLIRPIYRGAF